MKLTDSEFAALPGAKALERAPVPPHLRLPPPPSIYESAFQEQVLELARLRGWLCYHTHDSRKSEPGFPDLVLVRDHHELLFRELKTEKGRLTKDQRRWLDALTTAGADAAVWRPQQWGEILTTLA